MLTQALGTEVAQGPGCRHQAMGPRYQALGTEVGQGPWAARHQAMGLGHPAVGPGHQALGQGHQQWCQADQAMLQAPSNGAKIPGPGHHRWAKGPGLQGIRYWGLATQQWGPGLQALG